MFQFSPVNHFDFLVNPEIIVYYIKMIYKSNINIYDRYSYLQSCLV